MVRGRPSAAVRVLLVDDEAMIRAGVRAILARDPGIEVVAEAADGREGVEMVRAYRPDVVLVDIRMPVMDGLDAAAEMRRVAPGTGVVVLTTFGEEEYVVRALAGGADGFLLKTGDPRELILGVRAVAEGGAFLSPRVARRVLTELERGRAAERLAAGGRVSGLTPREREVLALLGAGLSNAEIGRRLFLVEGTVKGHVSTILKRLGVRNRVEAAVLAHEAGLVDHSGDAPGPRPNDG
ncbi:response regulator [Nocardiopsis sp. NPDC101807]|uniref:response regulator n=1 Tax=Nocardiopsis sp. NPDC101807 TaxID=3364339 RepID=UPI00382FC237